MGAVNIRYICLFITTLLTLLHAVALFKKLENSVVL